MEKDDKKDLAKTIGVRIRSLREEIGLSLKDLAQASALSPSFLSRVENGRTLPSLPALCGIAEGLGVEVETLFSQHREQRFVVSRKQDRRRIFSIRGDGDRLNYEMELLAEGVDSPLMEPALVTALRGETEELELTSHDGQEFCYVLEGPIQVILGPHRLNLDTGDAIYWEGNIPHGAVSLADKPAKTLNVHLVPGKRTGSFQTTESLSGWELTPKPADTGLGKKEKQQP